VFFGFPFQFTTDPETNPDPFMVNIKSPSLAFFDVGDIEVIRGVGLITLSVITLDVPPPGGKLYMLTLTFPAAVIYEDGRIADNCVLLI
jgi:hypothetical protein